MLLKKNNAIAPITLLMLIILAICFFIAIPLVLMMCYIIAYIVTHCQGNKKSCTKSDKFVLFQCRKNSCDSCKVILIKESDFECTAFLAFLCDNSCFSAEGVIERKLNLIKECVS